MIQKEQLLPGFFRLFIQAEKIAQKASPGQFAMIYPPGENRLMLARPFSIAGANYKKGQLAFIFEVVGAGTRLLAGLETGDEICLVGPLGRGFPPLRPSSLLVAGGIGIAPLLFLVASSELPRKLIYGTSCAVKMLDIISEVESPGLSLLEVTEKGDRGEQGSAVDLMVRELKKSQAVYSCGPRAMLAEVARLAHLAGVPAWISLEEKMACGIGACLGCAVKTVEGYGRVCSDGPVFPAGEVFFDD